MATLSKRADLQSASESREGSVVRKPLDMWLFITGLVVGAILYLLPKTSLMVILLVVLCFLLLIHPIWNFWWIEGRRWRRLSAVTLHFMLWLLIAIAAWPRGEEPHTASDTSGIRTEPSTQTQSSSNPTPDISQSEPASSPIIVSPQPETVGKDNTSKAHKAKTRSQTASQLGKARQLYFRGRFDEAISECDRILMIEPNNMEARKLKSQIVHTRDTLNTRND